MDLPPQFRKVLEELGLDPDSEEGRKVAQDTLTKILAKELPAQFGKPDWQYVDVPKIPGIVFDMFCAMFAEDEILWITKAQYPSGTKRGQCLVSPAGMTKISHGAEGMFPWDEQEPN